MSVLYGVPLDAAVHLITALASVVSPVIAIVLFTLAVRLLLMPLSYRAFRGQAAQAAIAPKLQALRERYGQQPQRLRTEMTTLYQQEGVSMYAGFGPLLLQWPFMSVMYLTARRVGGSVLGVPLSTRWLSAPGPASVHGVVFLVVFCVLGAIGYLSMRLTANTGSPRYVTWMIPLVSVGFVFSPLAAGIYLVTTTAWTIAERRVFKGGLLPRRRTVAPSMGHR
jgi:YidC/Oxa1 family membrane protein insertase